VSGFAGGPVVPMLYGHPTSESQPSQTLNLGLQKFHYDLTAVRAALAAQTATAAQFVPGIGIHRWP